MEPNSAIGLSNRLIAPFVQRAYTAFVASERHFRSGAVLRTGVPIRHGFAPRPYERGRVPRVLVIGGSQGSQALNETVPRALAAASKEVRVTHQCGAGKDQTVRSLYAELGMESRATVVPFIADMPSALGEADLVIGRAGANAVAEICAVGRPSILVPYPFAGDHQRFNADELVSAGAALCILSAEATTERLAAEVTRLLASPKTLMNMASAARALGKPDAAKVIARDLLALAGLSGLVSSEGAVTDVPDGGAPSSRGAIGKGATH
jgi:UDP-N-acetylglucosamine--N-acetylmuramyl-(pentapeptide) pyrophosphoryl-undecaprenol N-acetylglucosamine transferase